MSTRKFGVEIEYISKISHRHMVEKLCNLNLVIDNYATGYARCPNECYSGWQVKSDGSITVQNEYEYGIELVSPPLTLGDFGQLKSALSVADDNGAVNSSCGLHVHIHTPELYKSKDEKIITEWSKIEQTIFSYMPLSRRTNVHCKAGINHSDRYRSLNIAPLRSSRQTIEFRAHSATLNYLKVAAWVMLCMKFVERMVSNRPLEFVEPQLSLNVPTKMILPKTGEAFYLHRPKPGWVIETNQNNKEFLDLRQAWKEMKSSLKLPGVDFLSDFRLPIYGNAMTQLCAELDIKGIYRSYIEDRYDRITRKFGFYSSEQNITTLFGEDDEDFYNEPDYVTGGVEAGL